MLHVALLRAVNVGGRASLKMSDLRDVADALGFARVQTLLQSGNLVFEAKGKAAALEGMLEAALKKHTGMETDFLVRSATELDAIIKANPFPAEAKSDPGHLVVMFLKDCADAKAWGRSRSGRMQPIPASLSFCASAARPRTILAAFSPRISRRRLRSSPCSETSTA